VTPSPEYRAIKALKQPERSVAGDMWLCRRLGIVSVFNGHKRGTRYGTIHNHFHLYHWRVPSLYSHPCDWRDNDPNAFSADPAIGNKVNEHWEYIGNIFELLPYSVLAGEKHE
jgi:hypothetical protein